MKALEERTQSNNMPLAVICTQGCDPKEAELAIAARKKALERAGYDGILVVLDR